MKGISVIICCYNSSHRLPETVRHICRQEVAFDIPWEVIIVNNNSTDDTVHLAETLLKKYSCSAAYQIVDEPEPGLSHAREKGIATAQYDFLLFCDDDNWLEAHYVQRAYELMKAHPEVGALGGQISAAPEINPAPAWFEQFKGGYVIGKQANVSGDITEKKGYLFGAGIVIRRTALEKLQAAGYRSLLTGRKGSKLTAGDDAELCYAIRMADYRLWYDEGLKFRHFIPAGRLKLEYAMNLYKGFGQSLVVLNLYQKALRGDTKISQWYFLEEIFKQFKNFSPKFLLRELIGMNKTPYFQWPYMIMTISAIHAYWQERKHIRKYFCQMIQLRAALENGRKAPQTYVNC